MTGMHDKLHSKLIYFGDKQPYTKRTFTHVLFTSEELKRGLFFVKSSLVLTFFSF